MAPHPADDRLAKLEKGFRSSYLDYETLTAQLRAWADAFPEIVRLESIGKSGEGRDLWVLTIGPEPDRARPAVWVDGNLHAMELAGSSVALGIAEDAIRAHLSPDAPLRGLAPHVVRSLTGVLFHVMPRITPDGAEAVLTTGRYVRSVPRDARRNKEAPRFVAGDVDGDGLALMMRIEDPAGDHVESKEVPGLLVARTLGDPPPYYKVYPEGHIEHFDGHTIPDPGFLSDNFPDLNRNFPHAWQGEPEQRGAGLYPGSEPESRSIIEFASAHPNLFAWLNLHCFGGVYIRPLGHDPDNKMDRVDLSLYREVEGWADEHTGYPMVSGYEEFTYTPEKPLCGDIIDFAFHERGCLGMACELWDLFTRIGLQRQKRFVDVYSHLEPADMVTLAKWDAENNDGRIFRPWKKATHPQLGEVEVGGVDGRVGFWSPPYDLLDEVCRGQSAVWLRVAAMAPRVRIAKVDTEAQGGGLTRIVATVENLGYLPTNVLESAKQLPMNEPLWADLSCEGPERVGGAAHQALGHLAGWGRGRHGPYSDLTAGPTRGSENRATVEWTVRGKGSVTVLAGSSRVGRVETTVDLG